MHVTLRAGANNVTLRIRDDGPGFDMKALPRTRRGMGLATMRERAQEIGARLDIRTRAGARHDGHRDGPIDLMNKGIRLLIVDDHSVVREGLRAFLRLQDGIDVVGEAGGADEAIAVASTSSPDVMLLDLVMPGGDGVGAIRRLLEVAPGVRVLVLTSFADDAQIFAAIAAGAAGYLLKNVDPQALADGIRDVYAGRPALDPSVAARLMHRSGGSHAAHGDLTARERDVLRLVVEGLANKQIAQRLGIGEKTIKTHVSRVLAKLGVEDRTQAAVLAIREGLVD